MCWLDLRAPYKSAAAAMAAMLFAVPAMANDRFALLIANQKYAEEIGPLTKPVDDVRLIGDALKQLGFKVTTIHDADFKGLHQAISRHIRNLQKSSGRTIGFVYYSGHGVANAATKTNYLVPVDVTDPEDESLWSSSVDLQADLIDKLRTQAGDSAHFVIFDACRNELKLKDRNRALVVDGKSFVPAQYVEGMLIAYSAQEGRTTRDDGIYASVLAKHLREKDEAVMVFRRVQIEVQRRTKQLPLTQVSGLPAIYLAGEPPDATAMALAQMKGPLPAAGVVTSTVAETTDCPELVFFDYTKFPPTVKKERRCLP